MIADHLPTTATCAPVPSIAALFAEWCDIERATYDAKDDDAMEALLDRAYHIAQVALALPAVTAADVWALIRMAQLEADMMPWATAEALVMRAHAEAGI